MAARVPPLPPGACPPADPGGAGWTRVAATPWLAATDAARDAARDATRDAADGAGNHDDRAAGARRAGRAAQDFLARAFPVPTSFRTPTLAHVLGAGLPAPEALRRVVVALAGRVVVANPVGAARLPWALREGARGLVRQLLAGADPAWLCDADAPPGLPADPRRAAEGRRARALLDRALDDPTGAGRAALADRLAARPVTRVALLLDECAPTRLALVDGWRGDAAAPVLAGHFAHRLTIVLAADDPDGPLPPPDAPGAAAPWPVPHALPQVSQRTIAPAPRPGAPWTPDAPWRAAPWADGDVAPWDDDAPEAAPGAGAPWASCGAESGASPDDEGAAGRATAPDVGRPGGPPRIVTGDWFATRLLVPEPWLLPRLAPGDVARWRALTRGGGPLGYWAPDGWGWLLERPGGRVVTPDLVGRAIPSGAPPGGGALALSPAAERALGVPPGWALLAADATLLVRVLLR